MRPDLGSCIQDSCVPPAHRATRLCGSMQGERCCNSGVCGGEASVRGSDDLVPDISVGDAR